ncbi:MAG: hypothetical protein RIG62_21335 [Cyclobacteriaceae bacterium]
MENTTVEWVQINNTDCLKFTFNDVLTHKEALIASEEWKKAFQNNTAKKFMVIFDAKAMKDYEPMARSIWQKTISELKKQIDSIWVITDSKIIAAGAKIMGVFTSFSIKTVDSEEKITLRKEMQAA